MKFTAYIKTLTCCCLLLNGGIEALADSKSPAYAEDYQFITNDGGWCWFSDPRAIYVGNKMIGGYTDDEGSIWAFSYDPHTQHRELVKVYNKLQYDDHVNPSVLELEDKRIAIFFSKHGGHGLPIYYYCCPINLYKDKRILARLLSTGSRVFFFIFQALIQTATAVLAPRLQLPITLPSLSLDD